MSGDLIVSGHDDYMPVMSIDQAVQRRQMLVEYTRKCLVEGHDFGKIPGAGDKPTLLKPGAEKLCTMFGLTPKFDIVQMIERWDPDENGELLFYYVYRCSLYRGDRLLATGDGSCNSREKKYRYRNQDRKCPKCGAAAIRKSKEEWGGGYYCNAKSGGCGAKFGKGAAEIEGQETGQVYNPDVCELINTLQKMAQKRAFIAATLIGVNASEFYTQDAEDIPHAGSVDTDAYAHDAPPMDPEPPAPKPAEDPLTTRRRRALLTFKEHFTAESITKCLPPSSVQMVGEKIHLGKTFGSMSEEDLEKVEIFMADPNAPVKEATPPGEPTDAELVAAAQAHVEQMETATV